MRSWPLRSHSLLWPRMAVSFYQSVFVQVCTAPHLKIEMWGIRFFSDMEIHEGKLLWPRELLQK